MSEMRATRLILQLPTIEDVDEAPPESVSVGEGDCADGGGKMRCANAPVVDSIGEGSFPHMPVKEVDTFRRETASLSSSSSSSMWGARSVSSILADLGDVLRPELGGPPKTVMRRSRHRRHKNRLDNRSDASEGAYGDENSSSSSSLCGARSVSSILADLGDVLRPELGGPPQTVVRRSRHRRRKNRLDDRSNAPEGAYGDENCSDDEKGCGVNISGRIVILACVALWALAAVFFVFMAGGHPTMRGAAAAGEGLGFEDEPAPTDRVEIIIESKFHISGSKVDPVWDLDHSGERGGDVFVEDAARRLESPLHLATDEDSNALPPRGP